MIAGQGGFGTCVLFMFIRAVKIKVNSDIVTGGLILSRATLREHSSILLGISWYVLALIA